MKDQPTISRLDILNKRDNYFEFIADQVDYFKDFLSTQASKKWNLNSNILEDMYQKFLNLSKPALKTIKELRKSCVGKRAEIIADIKLYSQLLSNDSDEKIKEKFAQLTINYEKELENLKKQLKSLIGEKEAIIEKKITFDGITKQKIEAIREKLANDEELNVDIEHENIRVIIAEHKEFIREEIEVKLIDINKRLKSLNNEIREREEKHIEDTYKFLENKRKDNKDEFILLVEVEKDVILKTLKFQDYLEDVENFYNDQVTLFNIMFKSKKIIKLNKSRLIFKDVNDVMVDMISTEGIFDEINKETLQAEYLIESKKGGKLRDIQANLIGVSETSTDTLLGMVRSKSDLRIENTNNKEEVE